MALKGAPELRRRLKAIKTVFRPVGRDWSGVTVRLARSKVRVKTGQTHASIRANNALLTRASVEASGGARFLEAGTRPHSLKPRTFQVMKFSVGGRPVFAKKVRHPGMRKQPFLRPSGSAALRKLDILGRFIGLWNKAA